MSLKVVSNITAYENIPMNVNAIEDNWQLATEDNWVFLLTENNVDKIFHKWVNIFFKNFILLS